MSASIVQVPTMPASTFATVPLSTVSTTYTTQALPTTTIPVTNMQPILTQPMTSTVPIIPIVSHDGGPVAEVELKKRLLDGQRELKEKQAEMEADKEKKLEEKADKHRTKAVKWIGRGFLPMMATRHETKATALDVKANEHFMAAEQLRLQAKAIDKERKSYDPPKEERKKPAAKTAVMRKPADAAPRATTPVVKTTAPAGAVQPRPVQTRAPAPAAAVAPGAAPSLQKTAVPVAAPTLQKQARTDTVAPEAVPVKTEKVVEQKPVEEAEAVPVTETKTEKTTEENADGEKVVEKKEEKHHHLLHKEKNSGTPAH